MILQNINIIGETGLRHIKIVNGVIEQIVPDKEFLGSNKDELIIEFTDVIAFPGLINSHDHLEFNLFPKLGNRIYKSYMEWGPDIHKQNKDVISEVKEIPKQLRAQWGMYKNLFNGITTVIHHGEYFTIENPLINIFQNCYSLHSVRLEKYWKLKLNNPFKKNWPFVIHAGEGTNASAFEEIDELIRWNLFKRKLIAVHGVAMNIQQARAFEALIWCPDSNFFLLNTTAKVDQLKEQTKIVFGTDSTVSSSWSVWEQIRLARKTNMLSDEELFNSLTSLAAEVWRLDDIGMIKEQKKADIIIAKMKDKSDSLNSFFGLNATDILLIIKNGEIILYDESLRAQLDQKTIIKEFCKVFINKTGKYVKGDLIKLMDQIKKYNSKINFQVEIG